MPGRTRRVRLLAVVVCIVTVFFLYERNVARVDRYADYFTRNRGDAVGGGAVLRKPDQFPLEPEPEPEPVYRPRTTSVPAPTTINRQSVEESPETRTRTPTPARTSAFSTTTSSSWDENDGIASKTPGPAQPMPYGDDVDENEEDVMDDTSVYTPVPQHWSKLPESFSVTSTIQLPTGSPSPIPLIQKQGRGSADKDRLAKIRDACKHAWKGFREQGWDYDEVLPLSGGGQNSFNGWGATLVDSLDTLWIMGMEKEFEEAVQKVGTIDFTTSSRHDIPLFEVTIRYLGGMLGAYDVSGRKHRILLDKAVELAEILYSAFDTPNRMPETYYYWKPAFASNPHRASTRAVMAEIGTLSLEFTRLAQLTLEPKYYDAVARITDEFEKWQNNTRLPGMWPTDLDASGCNVTIRTPSTPTRPLHQIPIPDGDSYMITSDPVKVDSSVISKAEHAVNKLSQHRTSSSGHSESIANPAVGDIVAGMRHKMSDDPWIKQESPIHDDTTNHDNANEPLSPGAGAPSRGSTLENPSLGNRPSDPLLPNAGSHHQRRQLEDLTPSDDGTSTGRATEDTQLEAVQAELNEDEVDEYEEPQEECAYQGFASLSESGAETFTLGGKSDSTYEYLPKEYLLLGGRVEQYKTMYIDSMKPVIEELIFRPMTIDNRDILVSGEVQVGLNTTGEGYTISHKGQIEHLTCFVGGMFAMGGKIFNLPEHVEIGRKLTDGCVWAYSSMSSGIMPDGATLLVCKDSKDCKWSEAAWHDALDPFSEEFRQEQVDVWKKQYEVDDIAAWRKEKAAEEAAASSAAAAAELAEETAGATTLNEMGSAEPLTVPDPISGSHHHHHKRQRVDYPASDTWDDVEPAPQPQAAPQPSSTRTSNALVYEDGHEHRYTDVDDTLIDEDSFYDPYAKPTPTGPTKFTYTPEPPATHMEYVKSRIEEERIPPGFLRIGGAGYILRPEAIESVFYMYRITGEQYWRDVGWKMFLAVEQATRAPYGHSSLDDVTRKIPVQTDKMESFWIAETLKYYYLLFDDPSTWSLDDWVLNTEAHFFRRPANPISR